MLCSMTAAWAGPTIVDGFYFVENVQQFQDALNKNISTDGKESHTKIRLMADIYLSDLNERRTFFNTYCGTLDGNGHTIWAARPEVQHDGGGHYHCQYLFTYAKNATFKNLTFKNMRVQSEDHSNQCVITSQATNCTFENITFDNVSVFSNEDNAGAVTGIATNCTLTNITVLNSDFTVDSNNAGGIAGESENSTFTACKVDDNTLICSDGQEIVGAYAGGLVGHSRNDKFYDCINSAFVAGDLQFIGGLAGASDNILIDNCLNTGMVISIPQKTVEGGFFKKYKNKEMPCEIKYYNGQPYHVRKLTDDMIKELSAYTFVGGIVGSITGSNRENNNICITKCANIGSVYSEGSTAGIAGRVDVNLQISDCFCDYFHGGGNSYDFIPDESAGKSNISSCLSITNGTKKAEKNITFQNTYTRSAGNATSESLATGEVCYNLGPNWQQNIGIDSHPQLGSEGLYHIRKVSNQYGTVCLPFYMKPTDKISYYYIDENSAREELTTLKFKYIEEVRPGLPVLFRIKDDDGTLPSEIRFDCAERLGFASTPYNSADWNSWSINGTYKQTEFTETTEFPSNEIFYLSDGVMRNAKKVTIAPFRAFFWHPDINRLLGDELLAKGIRIVLEEEDGSTTAIEMIDEDDNSYYDDNDNYRNKTYSLMGTRVGGTYRGIVIKNGKKVIQDR